MKDDIAELVKAAAAAAKHAPEHLQEAAFNKAFDALVGGATPRNDGGRGRTEAHGTSKAAAKSAERNNGRSLELLNRTDYPDIDHGSTGLVNSLRLLRAAKDEMDIDGLSAVQIARTLTDKFRYRISPQAIGQALNSAGKLVDRQKVGKDVLFRIMDPGERYLESPTSTASAKNGASAHRARKSAPKVQRKETARSTSAPAGAKEKKAAPRSSFGPSAAMEQLYGSGYFKTARSIASIIASLKHDAGRSYKPNELSPALLRWLRNGKLSRSKNTDGQYEYVQA
jgi:hypothetical protein